MVQQKVLGSLAVLVLVLSGCAGPQIAPGTSSTAAQPAGIPKRVTAAVASQALQIASIDVVAGSGTYQGGDAIEELVNSGLSVIDNTGELRAQLAEAVPTVENGSWRVFPDGRMETTWKLRPGIQWHDGTPFTVDDLLFTVALAQDRELPAFRERDLDAVERIEAPDPRTVVVTWKEPLITADRMFTRAVALPRPKHVLGQDYSDNKQSLPLHSYWGGSYVGTGPFKVRQWEPGSHLLLDANNHYVLGRPKIDEIAIRFIPDPNTLTANLLAGEVELTMGRALTLAQAEQVRDRWKGQVGIGYKNWIILNVQMLNPDPPLLQNVQFRRALAHALDRQQLVDELEYGRTSVAHVFMPPKESMYKEIESSIVKYEFDPRRATQMIQDLGYARGTDGILRDPAARELALETRTNTGHEERILAIADQFRAVGIASTPLVIADSMRRDLEYNYTYPGVRLWRSGNDPDGITAYHSRSAPLPETRFAGGNHSRYMNASLDALIDQYMRTLAYSERIPLMRQVVHHLTDQLPHIGIYYNIEPAMIGSRLKNVHARETGQMTEAWNAHLWELT